MTTTKTTAAQLINSFDNIPLPGSERRTASNQATQQEKQPVFFWLNVGIERNGKLVQLPMGIPLDGLKARKVPGPSTKNLEFRQLRQAEAQLWTKVQEVMASLKPGESVKLPFSVEIRRVEEAVSEEESETETSENPFAIGNLF